jgi:large subunit ribosomal protein L29
MKARELSTLPTPELEGRLDDAYRELFNLRFQRAQGQLTDTNSIKRVRHNIARIKTVLRQRQLAAQIVAQRQVER